VADSVPREKQRRWIGFIIAAQAAGFALGPGIGGFLYQAWGFSRPFLISAAIAFIASLLALVVLPETLSEQVREQARFRRIKKRRDEKGSNDTSSRMSAKLRAFIPLLIVDCGITFIYPFVLPQYPFFFAKILGYSAAQFGVIVSVYGLALAAFPMLLGRISELFPKKLLIILGSLLYSALNVAMLFLHQYALLIGAAVVTGIGNALLIPALSTIYLGATTEQNRSQVMGIRGTAISLGTLLGPLAQAVASPWITPESTFAIAIALSLVITLLAFVMLKR
jgi:MFS family permease